MIRPLWYFILFAFVALTASATDAPARGGDTPGNLAGPEALRQAIPALREQRHWTEFATPEQIALQPGQSISLDAQLR